MRRFWLTLESLMYDSESMSVSVVAKFFCMSRTDLSCFKFLTLSGWLRLNVDDFDLDLEGDLFKGFAHNLSTTIMAALWLILYLNLGKLLSSQALSISIPYN